MSLPHALLTSLLEKSCSGSELARRFDRSIGFFWHATHQQIYRELARLEEAGWTRSLPAETGRGRKRGYEVLPAGQDELVRWTQEALSEQRPDRSELMLRLRAAAILGSSDVRRDVQTELDAHRQRLAIFEGIFKADFGTRALSRPERIRALILRAGILQEQMWVTWGQEALQMFDAENGNRSD